jgi:CubicO group peptidase (beta-lactamase class C family)
MDSKKLDEMMASISNQKLAIDSVLVVRHGYIVFEKYPGLLYDKDMIHPIYSCTKSVIGALIGIAVKEGFIDSLQHKVVDYFSDRTIQNLDSRKQSTTLEHLLAMTGGMEWDEWRYPYTDPRNDWIKALRSSDTVQYVLDLPMASDPGVIWNYNGGYSYLLSAILTKTTKDNTLDFARKYLFDPLGISELNWNRDRNGIYDGAGGLSLTPRDMAKFGLLYLNGGKWDGKKIVPADFVAESVKTHHFFSASSGYGYESWWTYPLDGFYYAAGIYGQRIYIVPSLALVVVITANITQGPDPETQLRPLMTQYVMAACK